MGNKDKPKPYRKGVGNGLTPILITLTKPETPLPPLSSKVLGMPDVWDDFVWPRARARDWKTGKYDFDFVCQINCAEVAPHDLDHLLPQTGMLYFFDDPKNSIKRDEKLVLYYNGDLSQLKPYNAEDKEGDLHESTDDFNGYRIAFNDYEYINLKKRKRQSLPDHHLLGSPSSPDELLDLPGDVAHQWQMLLQLDAYIFEGYYGTFMEMCYFIDREDLLNEDFSKAWVTRAYD